MRFCNSFLGMVPARHHAPVVLQAALASLRRKSEAKLGGTEITG